MVERKKKEGTEGGEGRRREKGWNEEGRGRKRGRKKES